MNIPGRHLSLAACRAALALLLAVAAGCAFNSHEPRMYLLSPMTVDTAGRQGAAPADDRHIGVGPVRLPAYLDRPQIVSVSGGAEVRLHDGHRWAAPLASELPRVLAENLSVLLGSDRVQVRPWGPGPSPDVQVSVEVIRFHAVKGGKGALLWARWTVTAPADADRAPRVGSVRLSEPGDTASIAGAVAAQSRLLAALSRRIAPEVAGFGTTPGG